MDDNKMGAASAGSSRRVFLDYNASTPLLPRVLEAMLPFLRAHFANPSSVHTEGLVARRALEQARSRVASLVGAEESNVTFTSSATEAINSVFRSVCAIGRTNGRPARFVVSAVEHAAVLESAARESDTGSEVVSIPVMAEGALDLGVLGENLTANTSLACVMWANNETGVVFPIDEIARRCRASGVPLLVDAVQAAGKLPIDLGETPIDYLVLSSHKLFGPKGAGALVADPQRVKPLLVGGGQEHGRRAGTENVAAVVGFGEACRLAAEELEGRRVRTARLRDHFESAAIDRISNCRFHGANQPRLANTSNIGFDGVDGNALVGVLDALGVAVSTGSACHANTEAPSHVILAMTGSHERAGEAVRISLSHLTSEDDVDVALQRIALAVESLRS